MRVDAAKCRGCGVCVAFCPAGAISLRDGKAYVDEDVCLECGTCVRQGVVRCPGNAFEDSPHVFERPRSIRRLFGDPSVTHVETGVPGRGTEEVKTNDVTGRVRYGWVGVGLEVGRPVLGASIADIEVLTKCLMTSGLDIHFEDKNPLTHLMADAKAGLFPEEYRNERVVSAIIEFTIPEQQLHQCLDVVKTASSKIGTVFSLFVIARMEKHGKIPVADSLRKWGYTVRPNSKINLGLGRPIFEGTK